MSVILTSQALGLDVGDTYTGDEEDWALAQGYARRDGYTGPGVSNTGPAAEPPSEDLTLAENREDPTEGEDWHTYAGALDPAMILPGDPEFGQSPSAYDFDEGGVNDEAPNLISLSDAGGPAAGGETISLEGEQLEDVSAVTFGGTAATSFEVVSDVEITAVVPAHAAGAVDVVVTGPAGTDTLTGAYTYA